MHAQQDAKQALEQQTQRPVFAGEEEEFGDEELGDDVDLGVGQYVPNFGRSDDYVMSEDLQKTASAESQNAAALASVPEPVRKYLTLFHQAIVNNSVLDISNAYESHWNRLTEKYYQRTRLLYTSPSPRD